jgi:Ca-activated chloride channel family protein
MKQRATSLQLAIISASSGLVLCLTFFFLPGNASPLQYRSLGHPDARQEPIKLNVELVVLHATVQNRKRVLVSGLAKDAFQVYEDGVLQQISSFSQEDVPVTVGLVVDNSGSMRPKRAEVVAAALAFARSSNPNDQFFVVHFNEHVSFGLPDNVPFAGDGARLELALSRFRADGRTALYDGIVAALEHLKRGDRDKKVLIVISDGGDNASLHKLGPTLALAVKSEAIIYTVGLFTEGDPDQNPRVLKQLAVTTGGEAFLPKSLGEVVPICEQIARDIRGQYTVTYISTNVSQDGAHRAIQVKAHTPGRGGLFVRTRAGYNAPSRQEPKAAEKPE